MLSHLLRQKTVISGWHTNDDLRNCYDRCLAWNFKSCLGWASRTHLLLPGIFKRFRENICEDIKLKPIAPWRYVKVHWFFLWCFGQSLYFIIQVWRTIGDMGGCFKTFCNYYSKHKIEKNLKNNCIFVSISLGKKLYKNFI